MADEPTPVVLPVGRHFTPEEFACHDGEQYPVVWGDRWLVLVSLCDLVRDLWGEALSVVSGYRSPDYNEQLIDADQARGSHQVASGSFHTKGMAADLRPTMVSPDRIVKLHQLVLQAHVDGKLPTLGGLGIYPDSGWIHVDTFQAPDGHLRRWTGR